MKKFNFKTQLSSGNDGEADFQKYYPELKPVKSEDLKYDFLLGDGKTLELKTDTYSMLKTPNFFLESISDTRSMKPGGVIRAFNDKIDYFVYYFVSDKTFYWFSSNELYDKFCEYLTLNKPPEKNIQNRGYTTVGFAIPRSAFESILIKKDVFN